MHFDALPGSDGFGRVWSNAPSALPNDGTPYLDATSGDSLEFYSGGAFGIVSVDLAGYSTVVPNADIEFVGHRVDGSTITAEVTTQGIIFQTYYFSPQWSSGLSYVEVPTSLWSLDNLVVSVPEPRIGVLALVGGLALGLRRMRTT